jgi:hypothetical protein
MVNSQDPPFRNSKVWNEFVNPSGPHQRARRTGSRMAEKTDSGLAGISREWEKTDINNLRDLDWSELYRGAWRTKSDPAARPAMRARERPSDHWSLRDICGWVRVELRAKGRAGGLINDEQLCANRGGRTMRFSVVRDLVVHSGLEDE